MSDIHGDSVDLGGQQGSDVNMVWRNMHLEDSR